MREPQTTFTECSEPGCTESIPDHRWGRTKADGWFEQRDGRVWCPAHVPAWVAGWRARRDAAVEELPEAPEWTL